MDSRLYYFVANSICSEIYFFTQRNNIKLSCTYSMPFFIFILIAVQKTRHNKKTKNIVILFLSKT